MREEKGVEASHCSPSVRVAISEVCDDILDAVKAAIVRKDDKESAVAWWWAQDNGACRNLWESLHTEKLENMMWFAPLTTPGTFSACGSGCLARRLM